MSQQIAAPQKEPFWFRPEGRAVLLILSILSLGYFLGVFMASARRSAKTTQYLFTLLIGIWANIQFNFGTQGFVMFAVVVLLMATFTKHLVPPAIESSVEYQLQKTGTDAKDFKLPDESGSGNGLKFLFKAKHEVETLMQAQQARTEGLATFYADTEKFKTSYPAFQPGIDTDAEVNLLTIEDCYLFEPRKGQTITERETQSGGRPFVGTKVGPIFVGGSGRSTSHSRSVTTQAPDVLQTVDTGTLIVTTRSISFVGEKYTRHVDFKTLISAQGEYEHMTFADSKKSEVWGAIFASRVDMWIVNALIGAADELSDRKLDTSGKASVEEINAALKKAFDETVTMLGDYYKTAFEEFEAVNEQLREFHRVYPNQVPEPTEPATSKQLT